MSWNVNNIFLSNLYYYSIACSKNSHPVTVRLLVSAYIHNHVPAYKHTLPDIPDLLWKTGFYTFSPVLRTVTSTPGLYHTPKLPSHYIFKKILFHFRYFISWPQNTLQASQFCSIKFIIPAVANVFATTNMSTAKNLPLKLFLVCTV